MCLLALGCSEIYSRAAQCFILVAQWTAIGLRMAVAAWTTAVLRLPLVIGIGVGVAVFRMLNAALLFIICHFISFVT